MLISRIKSHLGFGFIRFGWWILNGKRWANCLDYASVIQKTESHIVLQGESAIDTKQRKKTKQMTNLWEETILELNNNGKTFDDVVAICGGDFQITKDDFIKYSKTNYDDGYGAQEVATDLLIIGVDFWLERYEYDGLERWDFRTFPQYEHLPFKPINALTVRQAKTNDVDCSCGWESLASLNACTTEKGGAE